MLKDFIIYVEDEKIALTFTESNDRIKGDDECIMYEKKRDSTFVSCLLRNGKEKEIEVEESMLDAFCEDYMMFLINHCTISDYLKLSDNSFKTNTNNRIFECLKSALESREEKFKVRYIDFNIFNSKQIIELLQFMNPVVLTRVKFSLSNFDDVIDFLVNWNQGCRLNVSFLCMDLSTEILTSFKKMLNYPSVFSRITLSHERSNDFKKEQLVAFFEPFKPSKYKSYYIEFELEDPSVVNLAEQADCLSLQDVRSLEVFANPLLMEIIAEEIDYFDILRLRKVSRDIRSCIDALKLDPHIAGYEISTRVKTDDSQSRDGTNFLRKLYENAYRSIYRQKEYWVVVDNHIVLGNGKEKYVTSPIGRFEFAKDERAAFIEAANQFKINILHQKSIMDQFILRSEENVFELTGSVLKSRDTPLRVKKLMMTRANENEIMNILPYLDSVESIVNNFDWEHKCLNLAEVSKLVQWRNALELEFFDCIIKNSIEELNLINFRKIDIEINSISMDDVIYLKKNIPKSSNIEIFKIKFIDSLIDDSLYTLLPPFKRVLNIRSVWYSPMLNSNEFVHISLHEQEKVIILKRVNRDSVPIELL